MSQQHLKKAINDILKKGKHTDIAMYGIDPKKGMIIFFLSLQLRLKLNSVNDFSFTLSIHLHKLI